MLCRRARERPRPFPCFFYFSDVEESRSQGLKGRGGRQGDRETRRQGDKETGRRADKETRRRADKETGVEGRGSLDRTSLIIRSLIDILTLNIDILTLYIDILTSLRSLIEVLKSKSRESVPSVFISVLTSYIDPESGSHRWPLGYRGSSFSMT